VPAKTLNIYLSLIYYSTLFQLLSERAQKIRKKKKKRWFFPQQSSRKSCNIGITFWF